MKKKILIIILVCIISILSIGIINYKTIINKVSDIKYLNILKNYYNGHGAINGSDKGYKYLHGYIDEEVDISDGMENYLKCIEKSVNSIIKNEQIRFDTYYSGHSFGKSKIYGLSDGAVKKISELITDSDIVKFSNNSLIDDIVLQLERNKNLIHKSSDKYKEWYIKNDKDVTIELPYNSYARFVCDKIEFYDEVEEILKLKLYKVYKVEYCDVKYKSKNNVIKDKNKLMVFRYGDNKEKISIPDIGNLFRQVSKDATLTFGQYDYDKEREEWSRQEEERARQQWEYDQNPVVAQEYIDIPPFVKNIQSAYLFINKYEDSSMSIECVLIKRIKKDGNIADDKRQYILPYEDITTKEEALERYLSDKEHYDADEKWLKEGNIDYKGD